VLPDVLLPDVLESLPELCEELELELELELRLLPAELVDVPDELLDVWATLEVVGRVGGLAPVPRGAVDVVFLEGKETLDDELLEIFADDEDEDDESGLMVEFLPKDAELAGGNEVGGGNSRAPFGSR